MSNMKRKKKQNILVLIFLLLFVSGAAFAFIPGILDVVGRVGVRQGEYVRWILAATEGSVERTVLGAAADPTDLSTTTRVGFTHDFGPNRSATVHGIHVAYDPDPVGIGVIDPAVYLSHARIIEDNIIRERRAQRVEWSVVFNAAGTARLYLQAMNYNDLSPVTITNARVVDLTDVGVLAPLDIDGGGYWMGNGNQSDLLPGRHLMPATAQGLSDRFTVGGNFATTLTGTLTPNDVTLSTDTASTDIGYVSITWDGLLEGLLADTEITTWQWQNDDIGWGAPATMPNPYFVTIGPARNADDTVGAMIANPAYILVSEDVPNMIPNMVPNMVPNPDYGIVGTDYYDQEYIQDGYVQDGYVQDGYLLAYFWEPNLAYIPVPPTIPNPYFEEGVAPLLPNPEWVIAQYAGTPSANIPQYIPNPAYPAEIPNPLFVDNWDISGAWVNTATGTAAGPGITILPTFADQGDIFMTTSLDDGTLVALDALEGWIGTFVIELDYHLG